MFINSAAVNYNDVRYTQTVEQREYTSKWLAKKSGFMLMSNNCPASHFTLELRLNEFE